MFLKNELKTWHISTWCADAETLIPRWRVLHVFNINYALNITSTIEVYRVDRTQVELKGRLTRCLQHRLLQRKTTVNSVKNIAQNRHSYENHNQFKIDRIISNVFGEQTWGSQNLLEPAGKKRCSHVEEIHLSTHEVYLWLHLLTDCWTIQHFLVCVADQCCHQFSASTLSPFLWHNYVFKTYNCVIAHACYQQTWKMAIKPKI